MSNVIDLSWVADELRGDIQSVIYGEVITICEEALRKHVMNSVYNGNSPTMYERTFDVLNAVEVGDINVGGSSASFKVWVNPGKLGHVSPAPGAPYESPWGKHAGFRNQSFTDGLIEILDKGGGSEWYSHSGGNFYQKTYDQLNQEVISVLASGLAARGWDVSY